MSVTLEERAGVLSSSSSCSFSEDLKSDPRGGEARFAAAAGAPTATAPTQQSPSVKTSGSSGPSILHVNKMGGARAGMAEKLAGGSPSRRMGGGAGGTATRFTDPLDENGFAVSRRLPVGDSTATSGGSSHPSSNATQTRTPDSTAASSSRPTPANVAQTAGTLLAGGEENYPAVSEFARGLVERHLRCERCSKVAEDAVLLGPTSSIVCRRCAVSRSGTSMRELPRSLWAMVREIQAASMLSSLSEERPSDFPNGRSHGAASSGAHALHGNPHHGKEEAEEDASPSAPLETTPAVVQGFLSDLIVAEAAERVQIGAAEIRGRADVMTRMDPAAATRVGSPQVVPKSGSTAKPAAFTRPGAPMTSRDYKTEADHKYEKTEYTAALELYTKAIKMQPVYNEPKLKVIYGNRSAAHFMTQRYKECIEDCLEVIRLDPSNFKMFARAARAACTMGDLKQAISLMESIPSDSLEAKMVSELAGYRSGLETYRNAELLFGTPEGDVQYRMLVAQFSDTVPFRVRSAESLHKQKKYMRAVEVLEALAHPTRTPPACRLMSECLYLSGFEFFERARKCVEDASQLDDACNEMLKKIDAVDDGKQRGNASFNKKNYASAAEYYTAAIQAAADNDQVLRVLYCNRAAAYKELGRYREGIEDCTKALQIDGEFFKAYARRARCHEHLGDHFAAVRDFKKAIEYDSTDRELARELRASEQNLEKEAEREKDFYYQLGLTRTATEREIKLKYRELSLRWHPDKCIGLDDVERERAEHKFKVISEAHATLVDAAKRREYDLKQDRERFTRPGGYYSGTYGAAGSGDYFRGRHRAGTNGFW